MGETSTTIEEKGKFPLSNDNVVFFTFPSPLAVSLLPLPLHRTENWKKVIKKVEPQKTSNFN